MLPLLREEGKWLILESRDQPCFGTTDSNQDTVFQSPLRLAELIPAPLASPSRWRDSWPLKMW